MSKVALDECIEAIESGYEFLLAYAAQGFEANQTGAHSQDVRKHLEAMAAALAELDTVTRAATQERDGIEPSYESFLDTVRDDAVRAAGVVALVLSREGISSQIVDNFNASTHIRTVLTDLFLLDEALK
ncbi:MAG: hypothetical protein GKR90_01215 [Pseudomonadales bacterium]|nr:hypothetical protein [Pseudomonadales bacterium]